jgi:hypothetical protein
LLDTPNSADGVLWRLIGMAGLIIGVAVFRGGLRASRGRTRTICDLNGSPMDLGNVLNRAILPALNRCAVCGKAKDECGKPNSKEKEPTPTHKFERDKSRPEWHGWHAARRGPGTNLYRLDVPEKTIQSILRHANVSTTNTYYIKSAADDARAAMAKLECLVIGNEAVTNALKETEVCVSDNELTTTAADTHPAAIQ